MAVTRVNGQDIKDGAIVNADVATGAAIDATKIADGSVSNAEFQRLDGVTSGIQSQIDGLITKNPSTSSVNVIKPSGVTSTTSLTCDAAGFAVPGSTIVFQTRGLAANASFVISEVDDSVSPYAQIDVYRAKEVRFNNGCKLAMEDTDGSHAISLAVPSLSANYTLTFPAAAGASGQFLTTTGSGTLAFTAHGGTGDPHPQYVNKGGATEDNIITPDADLLGLFIQGNNASTGDVVIFGVVDRIGNGLIEITDSSIKPTIAVRGMTALDAYVISVGSRQWSIESNTTGSTGSFTFRLPTNGNGAVGQLLRTDGAGNTSWVNPSSGVAGADTQVQFNDGGSAFGGDADFVWNKTTNTLSLGSAATAGSIVLLNQGSLVLREANAGGSNTMSIRAASAINVDFTLTFPADAGSSGQVLRTDGTGTLSWVPNISSMNTLTASSQTFAKTDDTNVTLTINSATSTHTFALGWSGTLSIARGGTGAGTKTAAFDALSPTTTNGDIIVHNGTSNIRRAVGSNGQFLGVSAGSPAWLAFSTVAHSSLGSLTSSDDHTQYVFVNPTSGSRNNINAPIDGSGLQINANGSSTVSHSIFGVGGMFDVHAGALGARDHIDIIACPLRITSDASLAFKSGSNVMSFTVPNSGFTGSFTLQVPQSAGTSGQFLQTNGSTALTWANAVGTLNGLAASSQAFANSDDTNVTISIDSDTDVHTFTMGWSGTLSIARGGTGAGSKTAAFDALSPTTTKGDIIVSNGTDNIRLGVGTNTQVLTADSAEPSGVKWASVSTSASFVDNQVPTGTINGSNAVFTLASTPVVGSVHLYKNGIRQTPGSGNDFTISGATITFEAGNIPQTGDSLLADYRI